ncbi:hypothetical protein ACFL2K_05165, partial [Candidatus Margulisiibacteriota bacterium]
SDEIVTPLKEITSIFNNKSGSVQNLSSQAFSTMGMTTQSESNFYWLGSWFYFQDTYTDSEGKTIAVDGRMRFVDEDKNPINSINSIGNYLIEAEERATTDIYAWESHSFVGYALDVTGNTFTLSCENTMSGRKLDQDLLFEGNYGISLSVAMLSETSVKIIMTLDSGSINFTYKGEAYTVVFDGSTSEFTYDGLASSAYINPEMTMKLKKGSEQIGTMKFLEDGSVEVYNLEGNKV